MTASEAAKQAGLYSLAEVSRMVGKSPQTLYNWHKRYPELFRVVLIGCAQLKRRDYEKMKSRFE